MLVGLKENKMNIFRILRFELLLEEATSVLVFTKHINLSLALF